MGRLPASLCGAEAVAALAGATPVTKQSGKHPAVSFRWACNKRFRQAITTFADNSRHASAWAAEVYADALARGHDHPHAVRDPGPGVDPGDLALLDRPASPTTRPSTAPPTS